MNLKKSGLKALKYLQDMDRDDVLESVGLQERRSALATTLGSLGIFVLGCLVGAGIGLAFAPKSGDELRNELGDKVRRYLFVSTLSVFADFAQPNMDENAPLAQLTEAGSEDVKKYYGPLKALCEQEVLKQFVDRGTVVRPGLIVGHPQDARAERGIGEVASGRTQRRQCGLGVDTPIGDGRVGRRRAAELRRLTRRRGAIILCITGRCSQKDERRAQEGGRP